MNNVKGLDEDDDNETDIWVKSSDSFMIKLNKNYLKEIKLLYNIVQADSTAGIDQRNAIHLNLVDTETLNILVEYINYHKDEDYIAPDINENSFFLYSDRITTWDRNFLKEINKREGLMKKLLKASEYLLYDTLHSKISCFFANTYEIEKTYRQLFSTIDLSVDA